MEFKNIYTQTTQSLTSVERNFLLYINGKSVNSPYIAQYWQYEYNINTVNLIDRLLNENYLTISSDISFFKVTDLKNILKENNLPMTGKKDDLCKRLTDNLSEESLKNYLSKTDKKYILTKKGVEITKNLVPSATKDTDTEDKCISLILENNFEELFDVLNVKKDIRKSILADINFINKKDIDIDKNIVINEQLLKTSIIFCNIIGVIPTKTANLYKRISNDTNEKSYIELIIHTENSYIASARYLNSFKYLNNTKYKFLSASDRDTCRACKKLNHKVFNISEAQFGVNLPPIHRGCRCTIIPYVNDNY